MTASSLAALPLPPAARHAAALGCRLTLSVLGAQEVPSAALGTGSVDVPRVPPSGAATDLYSAAFVFGSAPAATHTPAFSFPEESRARFQTGSQAAHYVYGRDTNAVFRAASVNREETDAEDAMLSLEFFSPMNQEDNAAAAADTGGMRASSFSDQHGGH